MAKPAGREGGGGRKRTNLPRTAWTPKCRSVFSVPFLTPITPSDEIRKRSSEYAISWGGTDLLGGHEVRPDGHLQFLWGYLRH